MVRIGKCCTDVLVEDGVDGVGGLKLRLRSVMEAVVYLVSVKI